jgi:outer membrane protein OmpA-like peptidoglycan-associated protein
MRKHSFGTFAPKLATVLAVSAGVVAGQVSPAAADGFDLQQFQPMPDLRQNFFGTSSADVAHHMNWSAFGVFNYADDPLVLLNDDNERVDSLVASQGTLHLLGSVALFDLLEVGLDLPLIMLQGAGDIALGSVNPQDASFGVGDIRLVPKVQLFNTRASRDSQGLALAVLLDLHLPTGDASTFQGGDFRIGPRVAFDAVVPFGLRLGANLGYMYRPETQLENLSVNDVFSWALAAELPIADAYAVTAEFFGKLTPAGGVAREDSPTEFLLGGKAQLGPVFLAGGGGMGLVNGYGTPDWRGFLGLGFVTPRPAAEVYVEPEPECYGAGDCADVPASECANGVLVTYGASCVDGECVYTSSEVACGDGMMCGEEAGEATCVPEPECNADGDCTAIPETTCYQGTLTTYGGACQDGSCVYTPTSTQCPEGHICGVADGVTSCVKELVRIDEVKKTIELSETVFFETNEATIEARSFPMLDQVVTVLKENPQVTKVRIEGHTDDRGNRTRNLDLSKRRAAAVVDYLVGKGIERERLDSEGFGQTKPIAPNTTEEGRAKNRRVEIHIVEQGQ